MNHLTRLVATRELRAWIERRSTWVVFSVLLVGSIGLALGARLIGDGPTNYLVGVTDSTPTAFVADLEAAATQFSGDAELEVSTYPDADQARLAVEDGTEDVVLVWGEPPVLIHESSYSNDVVGFVQQGVMSWQSADRLAELGLGPDDLATLADVPGAEVETLNPQGENRAGVGFIIGIFCYMLMMLLVGAVAQSVAAEKANRVLEVLLPVLAPRHLLNGKIIAAVLMGLAAVATTFVPLVVISLLSGLELPEGTFAALLVSVPWLLGGATVIVMLAAAAGAMVDRIEDLGSALMPLMMLIGGSYVFAVLIIPNPRSPAATIASIIPITSPLVLPSAVAQGTASWPLVVVSLVVLALTVVGVSRLSHWLFARSVVHTGSRVSWAALWKSRSTGNIGSVRDDD